MAVGTPRQPLEAGIPMHLERPLAQFARGGAGECAVQGIHLRQQADVLFRVAPHERHGGRTASIPDSARLL